ncbi:MAG: 2-phospho-L-lactate transferase [Anaerolineae bacterium]
MKIVAFAGGVGGAKLADGLQRAAGADLTVVVNTGDDFELHGLAISPDLDTVMYTLTGLANPVTGWGLTGDTFANLEMMSRYGAADWFRLGDHDLATHILRTHMLHTGKTLTQATIELAGALGAQATILPMTDAPVRTMVDTDEGELAFQEYFVHRRWQPVVRSIRFEGIDRALPGDAVLRAIAASDMLILCPSNPFVSIEPILSLSGAREQIQRTHTFKVAVSPIVGGEALKGPAAKMFRELGIEASALEVARRYVGLVDGFVLDQVDAAAQSGVERFGMRVLVTDTVMRTEADRERLAREIIGWGNNP